MKRYVDLSFADRSEERSFLRLVLEAYLLWLWLVHQRLCYKHLFALQEPALRGALQSPHDDIPLHFLYHLRCVPGHGV